MFPGMRELDKPQMNVLPPPPGPGCLLGAPTACWVQLAQNNSPAVPPAVTRCESDRVQPRSKSQEGGGPLLGVGPQRIPGFFFPCSPRPMKTLENGTFPSAKPAGRSKHVRGTHGRRILPENRGFLWSCKQDGVFSGKKKMFLAMSQTSSKTIGGYPCSDSYT
ncbi:hypothetical protein NQZ68_016197 [Dissostichus eleginoides]|nr:hypothetical protein NQZ68_016197 [Dissostichus eleginoides]